MNSANIEILTLTVPAVTERIGKNQLVGFDGAPCEAGDPVKGVAKYSADVGQDLAVVTLGVVELVAASPIAAGDEVYSDANANVTAEGSENPFGRAIKGGGVGDIVAILLK